jgi:putative Mn2+ efflux pump MntP
MLSIATSIDAVAVGVAFAIINQNIFLPALIIGTITFILSVAGVKGGDFFGKFTEKAQKLLVV